MNFTPLFAQDTPAPAPAGGDTGQQADGGAPAGPQPAGGMGGLLQFAPFILLGLFFLVVLLPAQRRQKREAAARLAAMRPGAKVILNSGIVGRITNMKEGEEEIVIKSDETKLRVLKTAVASVISDDTPGGEQKS